MYAAVLTALLTVQAPGMPTTPHLLIYGGADHDVFLGCLNCPETDAESVHNPFGTFGNPFSTDSLKNQFSTFGNVFNVESPCNEFSTTPPVLVDKAGHFYGEFTLNRMRPKRTTLTWALQWLARVCAHAD